MNRAMQMMGVVATALMFAWGPALGAQGAVANGSTWGQILVICDEPEGRNPRRDVAEVYDPGSNRFAVHRPVMQEGRTGTTATVISTGPYRGRVLVAGGFNQTDGPLSSSEIYDPSKNRFTNGPNLSTDHDDHTATVIGEGPRAGWILIAALMRSDLYDPRANHFVAGPAMKYERIDHTATPIASGPNAGKILFAGGIEHSGAATEIYDPVHNFFERGPRMNMGRDRHTATMITSGRNTGKILLAGGFNERMVKDDVVLAPVDSTELYDPTTNTFAPGSATAKMITPRASHTATVISSGPNAGKILIVGGEQNDRTTQSSTELYDPATNSFTPGPPLHSPRAEHIAITIASGPNADRILIAGGNFANPQNPTWCGDPTHCGWTALSSTELYEPATNRFVAGPAMRGAPGDVVAVQLPPGPL